MKKPISLHVAEGTYREMQELARREGRPVASLIREAMADYVSRSETSARSLLEIPPHDSGRVLDQGDRWQRSDLFDQMIER